MHCQIITILAAFIIIFHVIYFLFTKLITLPYTSNRQA